MLNARLTNSTNTLLETFLRSPFSNKEYENMENEHINSNFKRVLVSMYNEVISRCNTIVENLKISLRNNYPKYFGYNFNYVRTLRRFYSEIINTYKQNDKYIELIELFGLYTYYSSIATELKVLIQFNEYNASRWVELIVIERYKYEKTMKSLKEFMKEFLSESEILNIELNMECRIDFMYEIIGMPNIYINYSDDKMRRLFDDGPAYLKHI